MRQIDRKFHIEGEEIKSANGATVPLDEPLFLLRARDHLAARLLLKYKALCIEDDCTDYQLEGVNSIPESFEKFAKEHPERMKQPGITRGL